MSDLDVANSTGAASGSFGVEFVLLDHWVVVRVVGAGARIPEVLVALDRAHRTKMDRIR